MRAVDLDQELAGVPDAVEYPDLSGLVPNEQWLSLQEALYYLAWAQWDDGKHAEGLRSMRNRVRLYEQLASSDPQRFQSQLAKALADEAAFRAADLAGAQAAAMRAVKLDQELAGVPDAVEYPDLSGLVTNEQWLSLQEALYYLAWAQWDDGKHAEGLRSMRDRVRLYEQLARSDPQRFQAQLAKALVDEAAFRAADLAGAQAAAMRAVKLDQELAGVPDADEYPV